MFSVSWPINAEQDRLRNFQPKVQLLQGTN